MKMKMSDMMKDIYGCVPERMDGCKEAVMEAMKDLNMSCSNKVNGPIKSETCEYDPENGK